MEDLNDLYEIIDSLSTDDLVRMAGGHIESGEAMPISGHIRTDLYEAEISALQLQEFPLYDCSSEERLQTSSLSL